MSFRDKLAHAAGQNHSLVCVGLDPDPARIPADELKRYLITIIEATQDVVCAFKPNLAFFEQYAEPGYAALRSVLNAIPKDIPVIADAKRGDIGHTAEAYARAIYVELGCDAATVNAYGGRDAVAPFIEYRDKGVIVWCRSSNPGAGDIQDLPVGEDGIPLYQVVARLAKKWDMYGNVGLVCGATYPDELAILRGLCPDMPILVPGIGGQKGDLEAAVRAGVDSSGGGVIVNASRSILYASQGKDFATKARDRAEEMRATIERCRANVQQESPA